MYSVIGSDGQVYGPVDLDTLKSWCAQGRITPQTNLIDPISGTVVIASSLQDLFGSFPFAPPQQPGPQGPPTQTFPQQNPNIMMGQTPIQVNNYVGAPGYQMPYMPLKSKAVAAILAFFFGAFGVHRFYLGHNGTGAAMLIITIVTCGWGGIAMGIWALVDFVLILTGGLNDAQGRALTA